MEADKMKKEKDDIDFYRNAEDLQEEDEITPEEMAFIMGYNSKDYEEDDIDSDDMLEEE
jgi:hypothetical protein